MPLYRKFETDSAKIALWRIEEPASFFQPFVPELSDIQNENRRLQWLASRYLLHQVLGVDEEIINDVNGKPVLKNSTWSVSLSHTARFAAVVIHAHPVAIDVEELHPKVLRVGHKFLSKDEILAIVPGERIEKMMLYWSAKEALYKLYASGGLDFKTQLLIEPFELKEKGILNAKIIAPGFAPNKLLVSYEFFEGHVLSYCHRLEAQW